MQRRGSMLMIFLVIFSVVLAGCGGSKSSKNESEGTTKVEEGETFTLKAGHSLTEEHPYHVVFLN